MNIEESANAMLGAVAAQEMATKVGLTSTQAEAVKNVIQQATTAVAASKFMTKDQALLAANASKLSQEIQKRWAEGRVRYYDPIKYVRKVITSANGIVEIFTDALDKVVGITNISKGKLDEGEAMNIRRIELMYDNGAGITEKTADFAPLAATDDNAVLNGEVELKISGLTVLKLPANSFTQPDRTVQGSQANGVNLNAPIPVSDKDDIQILMHFPQVVTSGGGTADVIEFKIVGAGIKPR